MGRPARIAAPIWVAKKPPLLKWLTSVGPAYGARQRLLLLVEAAKGEREFLDALFKRVVAPDDGVQLGKADDLAEILAAPDRRNFFIGGAVTPAFKSLVLYRPRPRKHAIDPLPGARWKGE